MNAPLRCLLVEDSEDDARLVLRQLRRDGYEVTSQRVETPEAMDVALRREPWDLVISDYSMPRFSGLAALELLHGSALEVPLILVSGTIGEDVAVEMMKRGAADYLLKDRLSRLGSAVNHALSGARLRQERKAVDEALRRAEARYRAIFEHVREGILQATRDGKIIAANPALARMLGYGSPDEFRREVADVSGLCADSARQAEVLRQLDSTGEALDLELPMCRRGGEPIWVLCDYQIVHDADGVAHLAGTFEDITERKAAELALRDSLREKEVLLKEVHHRVKNNLQIITSLLRLEASRAPEPATRITLNAMQGRIRSMALLHEVLYRAENVARVHLGTYLSRLATQLFRSLASPPGGIRLELDLAPGVAAVEIDQAIPCGLIVHELVANALKHGFPGNRSGEVRIQLGDVQNGEQVRLRVADNGVGLPSQFGQTPARTLGLQLVSDLVRQLQGTLEVTPTPGAAFAVTFPVRRNP